MVEIRVNNKSFNLFKQVDVSRSLDEFSGEGRIIVTEPVNDSSFILMGDLVEIKFDDNPGITGYAEKVSDQETNDSHDISFRVRDKVCDIIDNSVPDNMKIMKNVKTYKDLCLLAVSGFGLNLQVIDEVNAIFNEDLKAAEVGQNCGELLQEYARKVQVFLNTDGLGNILIRRSSGKLKTILASVPGFSRNNIKDSSINLDYTKRFNRYIVRSNSSLASANRSKVDLNNFGEAIDSEIRTTRIFEKIAEKPATVDECKKAAEEEANIRRIRSFDYSCIVAGFSANGELWDIGKLASVKDPKKGVMGSFLIREVSWSFSNNGEITKMNFTYPDAYTGIAEPAKIDKKITKIASTYTVKSKDTLSEIAAQHNITVAQIERANPQISDPDIIDIGQQIKIPTGG